MGYQSSHGIQHMEPIAVIVEIHKHADYQEWIAWQGRGICLITHAFVIIVNVMSIQRDSPCLSLSFFSIAHPYRRFILAFDILL